MPTLYARIRAARVALGFRQTDLASEAGIRAAMVNQLEGGKDCPLSVLLACQSVVVAHGVELLESAGRLGLFLPPGSTEGKRLLAAREGLAISQIEMGSFAGVNDRSLRGIEKGAAMSEGQRRNIERALARLGVGLLASGGRLGVMFPTPIELDRRLDVERFGSEDQS